MTAGQVSFNILIFTVGLQSATKGQPSVFVSAQTHICTHTHRTDIFMVRFYQLMEIDAKYLLLSCFVWIWLCLVLVATCKVLCDLGSHTKLLPHLSVKYQAAKKHLDEVDFRDTGKDVFCSSILHKYAPVSVPFGLGRGTKDFTALVRPQQKEKCRNVGIYLRQGFSQVESWKYKEYQSINIFLHALFIVQ